MQWEAEGGHGYPGMGAQRALNKARGIGLIIVLFLCGFGVGSLLFLLLLLLLCFFVVVFGCFPLPSRAIRFAEPLTKKENRKEYFNCDAPEVDKAGEQTQRLFTGTKSHHGALLPSKVLDTFHT